MPLQEKVIAMDQSIMDYVENTDEIEKFEMLRCGILMVENYGFKFLPKLSDIIKSNGKKSVYLNNGRLSAIYLYVTLKKMNDENDSLSDTVFIVLMADDNLYLSTEFLTEVRKAMDKGASFIYASRENPYPSPDEPYHDWRIANDDDRYALLLEYVDDTETVEVLDGGWITLRRVPSSKITSLREK